MFTNEKRPPRFGTALLVLKGQPSPDYIRLLRCSLAILQEMPKAYCPDQGRLEGKDDEYELHFLGIEGEKMGKWECESLDRVACYFTERRLRAP